MCGLWVVPGETGEISPAWMLLPPFMSKTIDEEGDTHKQIHTTKQSSNIFRMFFFYFFLALSVSKDRQRSRPVTGVPIRNRLMLFIT